MSLREQLDALRNVERTIQAGVKRIEAVDADLKPDARHARINAVRDETMKGLQAATAEMASRAKTASDALPGWSQAAVRRRARFADDATADATQRLAYFQTLSRTPTGRLIDHLRDAIRANSIAKAEAVRLEFEGRSDASKFAEEFGTTFEAAVDPKAQQIEAELRQIIGVADFATVRIREFEQGKSDPVDRITAARAAGMGKPVEGPARANRAAALRV